MSEYRDPRIDPRHGDVVRLREGEAITVCDFVDDLVDYDGGCCHISIWRTLTRGAAVLWQDDAPPPADVALLASANRALAERVERAERMLLALAEEIDVNPWEYVVTSLGSVLGVESTADAVSAALRRLCGVTDG